MQAGRIDLFFSALKCGLLALRLKPASLPDQLALDQSGGALVSPGQCDLDSATPRVIGQPAVGAMQYQKAAKLQMAAGSGKHEGRAPGSVTTIKGCPTTELHFHPCRNACSYRQPEKRAQLWTSIRRCSMRRHTHGWQVRKVVTYCKRRLSRQPDGEPQPCESAPSRLLPYHMRNMMKKQTVGVVHLERAQPSATSLGARDLGLRRHRGDIISPEKRSALMSRIRGRDTGPEREVGLMLAKGGFFHETQARDLPGRPDFVMREVRLVVLVDGDFWLGWRFAMFFDYLSERCDDKISMIRQRDARNIRLLRRGGWKVVKLWEHEVEADPEGCASRIKKAWFGQLRAAGLQECLHPSGSNPGPPLASDASQVLSSESDPCLVSEYAERRA